MIGLVALEKRGTVGRHGVFQQQVQVFQQKGDALERPLRQAAPDLRAGLVVMLHDDGIDLRVERFGARNRLVQQVRRRHVAAFHQHGEPQPVMFVII